MHIKAKPLFINHKQYKIQSINCHPLALVRVWTRSKLSETHPNVSDNSGTATRMRAHRPPFFFAPGLTYSE